MAALLCRFLRVRHKLFVSAGAARAKVELARELDGSGGGGHLVSDRGYTKHQDTDAMHSRKLEELIVYLGNKPGVTNLGLTKLWKLIYFVDSQALRELGESVTGSEFIKYEHGPVPSRGDKHLSQMTRRGELTTSPRSIGGMTLNEVKTTRKPEPGAFSKAELAIIDDVCARYGRKSAKELSDLSHQEPSWHYAGMREKLSQELMLYGAGEDAEGL